MAHEAQTRLPWTAEEDAILISLVERYGEKRWNMVANGLPGRTGKGCSHRWRTYLRPDVKHPHLEPFTEWEAAVIVQAQRDMGNNWLAIAKLLLPGRSNTAVKNFWHCRLKSGSGTNQNRFIVNNYPLHYLLNEVPHEERIHPVALPAFPSTAPTGQLHHPKQHQHEQQMMQLPLQSLELNPDMTNAAAAHTYGIDMSAAASLDIMAGTGSNSMLGTASSAAGVDIVAATAAAAAAAAQQGPDDPSICPKEDLRRRASAYVQQQLALMGQPAPRHAAGGSSSQSGQHRRDSVTHTGTHSHVNNSHSMLAPHASAGWCGATGISAASSPIVKKGGNGRGRGRRPKARDSCDDPYDETYVPAGMSREEEIARCRNYAATSSPNVVSGCSGATVYGNNSIEAHHTYIPAASMTGYNEPGVIDAAAAAALPCMPEAASHNPAAATAVYQQYPCNANHTAGIDNSTAALAQMDHVHWHPAAASHAAPMGMTEYGISNHSSAAAMAADNTTSAAPGAYANTFCVAKAAVPSRTAVQPDSKFFGLEDAATVAEMQGFRQSGVDFKMSLSNIDELLSGGGPHGSEAEWAGLASVAGLFRGTSLDGSRFSLTGSADGAGSSGRRSSQGVGHTSCQQQQRQSQQQLVHNYHQQQQQQLDHMLMPPPRHHHYNNHHSTADSTVTVAAAAASSSGARQHPGGSSAVTSSDGNGASDSDRRAARSQSPFKATALQQQPFSPALANTAAAEAAMASGPSTAGSSQPMPWSASATAMHLNTEHAGVKTQQRHQQHPDKQEPPSDCQVHKQQQQQRLPAAFESVLQAILPACNASLQEAAAAHQGVSNTAANCHSTAAEPTAATVVVKPEPVDASVTQHNTSTQQDCRNTGSAAAAQQGSSALLRVQCPVDFEPSHKPHRSSMQLISPVGRYLARPSEDGCLLIDEALGGCGFDLHTAPDDSAQTRAERRSLRMLLGVLSNTDHLAWEPTAAADPATAEHGRRRCSSSRLSHSSLLAGGCGLGLSGRTSSRGLGSWAGASNAGTAAAVTSNLGHAPRGSLHGDVSLKQSVSNGIMMPPLDLGGKRPRMSFTLTSPVGGTVKKPRVSLFMDGPDPECWWN